MKNPPLVSIVIPVYNGSNYLSQAIESALSQTYPSLEVLVINDGSTDEGRTKDVAKSFGDRIRYFEKENGGVATALNLGIEMMKGDFFSWLSHDDLYYPNKIEKQIDFYNNNDEKNIVVFSHEDIIDSSGGLVYKSKGYIQKNEPLAYTLLYSRFISGCSLLIPRSAFQSAGFFDPQYKTVQDYALFFRIMAAGYSFEYCSITSGMARNHDEQDSNTKKALHRNEKDKLNLELLQGLPRHLWFEPLSNKVWAIFQLKESYQNQGLTEASRYCDNWLKEGVSKYPGIRKYLELAEYCVLKGVFDFRRILVKNLKSMGLRKPKR